MARVMICDDDEAKARELVAAIRIAGHEAATCRHTMDVLRRAVGGHFDLVAINLDMAGFGRTGAIAAMQELAPRVALIALHNRPSEIIQLVARSGVAAVLPHPVSTRSFIYAVARALEQKQSTVPLPTHAEDHTQPFIISL